MTPKSAGKKLEELKMNYDVSEHTEEKIVIPELPESGIILIVGSSGSGKSTILKKTLGESFVEFDNSKSVIENFSSLENGERLLKSTGLRSIPTWFRPFNTLSNGEAHRAYCALSLDRNIEYIDEFTSVVDRDTAKSLSNCIRKNFNGKRLVIATCHRDIEEWLLPDVIYDTDYKRFIPRRFLRRPSIKIDIVPSTKQDWILFKKHHYLTADVSGSCHFYTGYWGMKPVAFSAIIHRCGRDIKSYWGESRVVVLPEFQGLGIGHSFSNAVAEEYKKRGFRFFSKTAHPSLGEYRNKSNLWRGTSTNGIKRSSYMKKNGTARVQKNYGKTAESIIRDSVRVCYSHEFIGEHP